MNCHITHREYVCVIISVMCVQDCLEVLCSHSEQDIERRDNCNRTIHDVATDDCKDLLENLSEFSFYQVPHRSGFTKTHKSHK